MEACRRFGHGGGVSDFGDHTKFMEFSMVPLKNPCRSMGETLKAETCAGRSPRSEMVSISQYLAGV